MYAHFVVVLQHAEPVCLQNYAPLPVYVMLDIVLALSVYMQLFHRRVTEDDHETTLLSCHTANPRGKSLGHLFR